VPKRELTADQWRTRNKVLSRAGLDPGFTVRLGSILERAVAEAPRGSSGDLVTLDAGCGRRSPLAPFRPRIDRFVGADIHAPDPPPGYLDEFVSVDLCGPGSAFEEAAFGLIMSNFTMEHFQDPSAALANFARWLRPGGVLVVTTVNRRHPFVWTYLNLPPPMRRTLQRSIKASDADAHALVGACNDPGAITGAMTTSGFERIEIETVGHLARAWARRWPAFALGVAGDVAANRFEGRRSTIIAVGRKGAN